MTPRASTQVTHVRQMEDTKDDSQRKNGPGSVDGSKQQVLLGAVWQTCPFERKARNLHQDDQNAKDRHEPLSALAKLEYFLLKVKDVQVDHVERYHFGGRRVQPPTRRGPGHVHPGRVLYIAGRLDEILKPMIVPPIRGRRGTHQINDADWSWSSKAREFAEKTL